LDRLEQLSAFVEATHRQSFAQAARQTDRFRGQPRGRRTRGRLGVRLSRRTTRGVTLSHAQTEAALATNEGPSEPSAGLADG
jgi:DNA-binding transcriptional LysR family regulator